MRKFDRLSKFGVIHGGLVLAIAACSSEDPESKGDDSNVTSSTAGTSTASTTTNAASTTLTSGAASTSGGVGATSTAGTSTTSGTTGSALTTGTGVGAIGSTSAGASNVTSASGSETSGTVGGTSSTTGGEDEDAVLCDTTLSGEDYYLRPQGCMHCHGEDALGTEDGPEARHPNADYLRWIIREGRMDHPDFEDGMPAVSEECITDQMIEEIITFLNAFPEPTTGAELYADYCANCHGEDGRGGVTGVSLDGELHENAQICVNGNDTDSYGNRESYMPGQGDHLTAAEIQLITDYLQNELGFRF